MTRRFTPTDEWQDARQRAGLEAELEAARFLTSCGYEIEHHRFRAGRHDLDLVARRNGLVAFVEVKSRQGRSFGGAASAIGVRKQRILARMAEHWRLRYGRASDTYRFDVVALDRGASGWTIEHILDAFRAPARARY